MNLVIGGSFDDGDFAKMHRNAVVGHQGNADFDRVVVSHLLVQRLKHVLYFGDHEVEGVAEDAVRLLFQPPGDDPLGKVARLVNCGLEKVDRSFL